MNVPVLRRLLTSIKVGEFLTRNQWQDLSLAFAWSEIEDKYRLSLGYWADLYGVQRAVTLRDISILEDILAGESEQEELWL